MLQIFGLGRIERGARGFTSARDASLPLMAADEHKSSDTSPPSSLAFGAAAAAGKPLTRPSTAPASRSLNSESAASTAPPSARRAASDADVDLAPYAKFFPQMPRFSVDDLLTGFFGDGAIGDVDSGGSGASSGGGGGSSDGGADGDDESEVRVDV